MTTTVRTIEAVDKERWLDLFRQYIAFYKAQVTDDVIATTWRRLLNQDDGMMALSAIDENGRVVGLAALVFHRSTWSPTTYCYLEDLFVDPALRGTGAGRALIDAVYAEADRRGATRTYWVTDNDNATARRLYNGIGELTGVAQYRRPEPSS